MSNILDAAKTLAKNATGDTALFQCTTPEEVNALIAIGFDVDAKNNNGATPLTRAAMNGRSAAAEALIAAGADVNVIVKNVNRLTPLHYACGYAHHEIAELLLKNGADVTAKTSDGWTPFHFACSRGRLDIVKTLLEFDADIDATADDGATPPDLCKTDELKTFFGLKTGPPSATSSQVAPPSVTSSQVAPPSVTSSQVPPPTATVIPLPSAIAPATPVTREDICSFHDMLKKAEAIMSAAKAQGWERQDVVRAASLYEAALVMVKQGVENLHAN